MARLYLLVSIFFITFSLHAKSIVLKSKYCVKDNIKLTSRFFDDNKSQDEFDILTLPKSRSTHSVPSLHVRDKFIQHGYEVIDNSSSIIEFKRYCNLAGKEDEIANEVLRLFEEKYPCIDADLPEIKASNILPFDFQTYTLTEVILRKNAYKNKKGSFKAVFTTSTKDKKIYFKFTINANIDVFKARHNLYNDKILSQNDYEKVNIKLNKLPSKVITCQMPKNLITKSYLREGTILSMQKFSHKKDALKGSRINAYIKDGMLVIGLDAQLLEDANVGDVARIKTDQGKLFKAKLVSQYEAIILQ